MTKSAPSKKSTEELRRKRNKLQRKLDVIKEVLLERYNIQWPPKEGDYVDALVNCVWVAARIHSNAKFSDPYVAHAHVADVHVLGTDSDTHTWARIEPPGSKMHSAHLNVHTLERGQRVDVVGVAMSYSASVLSVEGHVVKLACPDGSFCMKTKDFIYPYGWRHHWHQ